MLKAKLAALGAAILVVLGFFFRFKFVKRQRDQAVLVAHTIRVRHQTAKKRIEIEKEREALQQNRSATLAAELEKRKEERDMSQFTNPNDF